MSACRLVPSSFSWYMAYLWKVFPLDMSQYPRLFCSTRLPQRDVDQLISHPGHSHVAVMSNGHLYSIMAAEPDGEIFLQPVGLLRPPVSIGTPISSDVIHSQLRWILQQSSSGPPSHPISFLSASNRDWWADIRQVNTPLHFRATELSFQCLWLEA